MDTITEKVKKIVDESPQKTDSQFNEIAKFIEEVKKAGITKQPTYTLPLADTIGRKYYSQINKR